MPVNNSIPDAVILQKIRSNNISGWEELYEQYAPAMLGIICRLTNDKAKAEKILIGIFTAAGFETFLRTVETTLSHQLFRYTFHTTLRMLDPETTNETRKIEGLPGVFKVLYQKEKKIITQGPRVSDHQQKLALLPFYGLNFYSEMICYS